MKKDIGGGGACAPMTTVAQSPATAEAITHIAIRFMNAPSALRA